MACYGQVEWAFEEYQRLRQAGERGEGGEGVHIEAASAVITTLCAAAQFKRAEAVYEDMMKANPQVYSTH